MQRNKYLFLTSIATIICSALVWSADSPKAPCAISGAPVAIDPDKAHQAELHVLAVKTATDGPKVVASSVVQCHDNKCKTSGCATCETLRAFMPLTAQVVAVRCYSTAGYPNDVPLRQVSCGQDVAWSYFAWPYQTTTPQNTVVESVFYNRSHNRDRTIEIEVDYN